MKRLTISLLQLPGEVLYTQCSDSDIRRSEPPDVYPNADLYELQRLLLYRCYYWYRIGASAIRIIKSQQRPLKLGGHQNSDCIISNNMSKR